MLNYGTAEGMRWLTAPNCVELTVLEDGQAIICRVSRKCLEDNCGRPPTAAALLDAAKQNFHHIMHRVDRLIRRGRFESDGTILLRSSDW